MPSIVFLHITKPVYIFKLEIQFKKESQQCSDGVHCYNNLSWYFALAMNVSCGRVQCKMSGWIIIPSEIPMSPYSMFRTRMSSKC